MAEELKEKVETTENRKPKAEKKYTATEVEEIVQKAIDKKVAEILAQTSKAEKTEEAEYVTLVSMVACAEGAMVLLGTEQNPGLGEILGKGGIKTVRKSDFNEKMNPQISSRLKDRRLVVLSGLTDEERELYGVKYADGELLSKDIFVKLFDLTDEQIIEIFSKSCYRHKQIISTMFIDAYMAGNNRINQHLVERLNEISKTIDSDGMFTAILKDMYRVLNDKAGK